MYRIPTKKAEAQAAHTKRLKIYLNKANSSGKNMSEH